MILDEIVLHDFGIYGGRQRIELTPVSKRQPIILFGGLNGGGKTTLLDALQLCFFGNMADCAGRADLAYDEYLRRSVHHRAPASESAIEVAFRHRVNGELQQWRLTRSWTAGETVRERFQVIRNDKLDKAASEQWSAQVEDFIPARIAHLFLFDGEKVEGYADLAQAPGLIRTAIQNLLGLDIVERLGADLQALERRKRAEVKSQTDAEALDRVRQEIDRAATERTRLVRERAACQVELDKVGAELASLERRYEREGGAIFEDRSRLEAELAVAQRAQEAIRKTLRDAAAGPAPLALVSDLLGDVVARDAAEETARRAEQTGHVAAEEHAALLELPAIQEAPAAVRAAIERFALERQSLYAAAAAEPRLLDLDSGARRVLQSLTEGLELDSARQQLGDLLKQERQVRDSVEHLKGLLASVPNESSVAELIAEREAARTALKVAEYEWRRLDEEINRRDRELQGLRDRETKLLELTAKEQFEQEDVRRILTHSGKVRRTLEQFRGAVVERHVARIEGLVLDSFRQLVRKPGLVTGLRIDPTSFALELKGARGESLTAERLSAGERQLLAIAMLWGLGRASGRPLPTVIDTPLGRLDAEHRSRIVTRYFPHASHQVMLLSTDEEITRVHLKALKPSIGRMYRLRFDDAENRTVVEPGYFEERGLA